MDSFLVTGDIGITVIGGTQSFRLVDQLVVTKYSDSCHRLGVTESIPVSPVEQTLSYGIVPSQLLA